MILGGDIGGTKALLALAHDDGTFVRESVFSCADYASFEAIIDVFLAAAPRAVLRGAAFGVAGPVIGGVAKITNLPWTISEANLTARLAGVPVRLYNDLQMTALGALAIPASSLHVLQAGAVAPRATIAVIAPGTGLGEALLVWDGVRYIALPSEGGHADFAPGTDEEVELWRFLRGRHGTHISYERVLSGNGLGDLYDFCRARASVAEPAWLTAEIASSDRNAVIANTALDGRDPVCMHALDMFVAILGAEAGNLALRGLAVGGVVIGGGIPPKILPALAQPAFLARLCDKGRFQTWLRALPIRVSIEPKAALYGAVHEVLTR